MKLLKYLWEKWKKFAVVFGEFMSGVFLTLFYFLIIAPHAILFKLLSDPLKLKRKPQWNERKHLSLSEENFHSQS